jgi:hypothetical protein
MRRSLFPILGLIEVAAAVAMFFLGASLPGTEQVRRSFAGAQRVTTAAGGQVRLVRDRIGELRRSRLRQTADRLQATTRTMATAVRGRHVDFDTVRVLRDAMGQAADGLEGLAGTLDPDSLGKLGTGRGATADYLDRTLVPAASGAADDLEAASDRLQLSARRFGQVLHEVPLDLRPLREVHDGLARFDTGLAAMDAMLDPRRLAPLRQATDGAEGVVTEAARLAERAAGYSYPVVELDGIRPRVRNRPFWPRGAEVSADLRQVARGVTAMDRELAALSGELPKVQAAVAESRKALGATRTTLAVALQRQDEVERLLKEMPAHAARLAEELPRLTDDLSAALRDTGRLAEVAGALRQAQRGIDAAVASWPRVRSGLSASVTLLRATRDQLDRAIRERATYEVAVREVEDLSADLADLLPSLTDGLDTRLDEEDRTLAEMAQGLEQVNAALPAYSQAMTRGLGLGRLLAWLVAGIAALHGAALVLGGRLALRGAAPAPAARDGTPDQLPAGTR